MQPIWGIDLGGTKIEGVILESKNNLVVLERLRVPTESNKGYDHVIEQIQTCIALLQEKSGLKPDKIGIGTPGVLDPTLKTMKNCNSVVLNGRPLKKDLESILQLPVTMANDANCFAIAEAQLGIVRDHLKNPEVVFGVIMGTGVGGGVVVNSKVVTGRQGIGGEWGHNFLDTSGGTCYCGKTGCVETIIAGPSLERFYAGESGESKKLHEIVINYHRGNDPEATKTIKRLIHFFGKGISTVINILDPDAVVLGGGVGNIDLLYTEGVEEVKKHVFNNRLDTLFLKPKLGDSAGVFGAALL
jgi:predicted NBD/HSP70 family sugar kinase